MTSLRASSVKRLGAVFQQASDAVFLLDRAGQFAYVNRAWEALTGLDADAVLGQRPAPAADGAGPSAFLPPPESLEGEPCGGRALIFRANGERLWRRVEFWPYRDGQGLLLSILGLVRDDGAPPHAPDSPSQTARAMLAEAREAMRIRFGHETIVGRGPRHDRLMAQIDAASRVETPALIVGERGTGKRLVASVIHARGPHAESPFLVIDAEALAPDMIERELFQAREGSTLFLAHADRLPRDIQSRWVANSENTRTRLLCGTTLDPEQAVRDESWREDFYFAVSVQVLRLAPLRERVKEIPLLAQSFLETADAQVPSRIAAFSPDAIDVLTAYDWPGNVRELARVVEAARGRAGDRVLPGDLPAEIQGELASAYAAPPAPPTATPLDQWLTRLERRLIEQALQRARHNKSRAAEMLDISRPRLYRRIKELNIPDADSPDDPNGREEGESKTG
jgi:PAS domain S-box-containing protein